MIRLECKEPEEVVVTEMKIPRLTSDGGSFALGPVVSNELDFFAGFDS